MCARFRKRNGKNRHFKLRFNRQTKLTVTLRAGRHFHTQNTIVFKTGRTIPDATHILLGMRRIVGGAVHNGTHDGEHEF